MPSTPRAVVARFHRNRAAYRAGEYNETQLGRQIDPTEQQIDRLVYEPYGLTEEETRIVEGNETP